MSVCNCEKATSRTDVMRQRYSMDVISNASFTSPQTSYAVVQGPLAAQSLPKRLQEMLVPGKHAIVSHGLTPCFNLSSGSQSPSSR